MGQLLEIGIGGLGGSRIVGVRPILEEKFYGNSL